MALTKNTFTLILIFALLFVAQYSKVGSARTPASTPGPSSDEEALSPEDEASSSEEEALSPEEEAASPAEDISTSDEEPLTSTDDTSSSDKDSDSSEKDDATSSDKDDATSSEEDAETPTSEPTADSPVSPRELFEFSFPDIGLRKVQVGLNSEGAKVTNKQLEGMEHKMVEFKAILAKRQADDKSSDWTKKCCRQCQANYDDAIDSAKSSIEAINNQDLETANNDIGTILTNVETCNDCFVELAGEDKEIKAFNDWVKGVTKECLANIKKA